MPRFLPAPEPLQCYANRGPRHALLVALCLAASPLATPAQSTADPGSDDCPGISRGEMCISGENVKFSSRDDSWSFDKAELRDARGTRVTANTARGIERPGGLLEVDFTGKVHVEFRGAVLDADTATMVLRDEALVSVDVKGSQATFSHQPEKSKRRIDGKADAINYVAASGDMRFSGGTFWTNGSYTMNTPQLSYNLNSGDVSAPRSIGTVRPKGDSERVPAPRPPERSTAQ